MARKIPGDLIDFRKVRTEVEAVMQRIGRETWDLILIDPVGNWTRAVFPSEDDVRAAADFLDVRLHEGWTERMAARMNRRDHWGEPGGQKRAT